MESWYRDVERFLERAAERLGQLRKTHATGDRLALERQLKSVSTDLDEIANQRRHHRQAVLREQRSRLT